MNKGLITNIGACLVVISGLLSPEPYADWLLSIGLFALSGALTNSLAIHMLFERVPGFYGSGVITLHFEEFKSTIRELIMQQFFSNDNLDRFFDASSVLSHDMDDLLPSLVDKLDYDQVFDSLTEAIMQSSLGGMLGLVGGPHALDKLREPFADRMRAYLIGFAGSDEVQAAFADRLSEATHSNALKARVEVLVDGRLQELTPVQVKTIVQDMIRRHLGWLVVWGGVAGGLMGLLFALLSP